MRFRRYIFLVFLFAFCLSTFASSKKHRNKNKNSKKDYKSFKLPALLENDLDDIRQAFNKDSNSTEDNQSALRFDCKVQYNNDLQIFSYAIMYPFALI